MKLGIQLTAWICLGMSTAVAQTFEVASIKPAAPMEGGRMMVGIQGGPGTPKPGQMTFTNVSLNNILQQAYDVKDYQISGPAWMQSTRFDIEAKVPAGTTKEQSRIMLQNLLADRFKLTLHHSTKESSIYALLVAKGGPKLTESVDDPNAAPADGLPGPLKMGKDGMPEGPPGSMKGRVMMMMAPGGRMHLMSGSTTVSKFTDTLASQLDRPVVDMTGLTGKYDIVLDFAPDPAVMQARMGAMGVGPPPGAMHEAGSSPDDPNGSATIFSALTEQLGLRLEARKGPVDLLVIDSAQKTPTEN